jgi:hypothetical protein
MDGEAGDEPDGENDPGLWTGGLPAPDKHRDQSCEYERFEEGQRSNWDGRLAGHLVNRFGVSRFGGVVAGIVHVDETEGALEELFDVLFADEARGEEFIEIEIGEASIGDPGREHFQQKFSIDGAEGADLFENDTLNGIDEFAGIDEAAEFDAGDGLDENGAEQADEVALGDDVFADVGGGHGWFCDGWL